MVVLLKICVSYLYMFTLSYCVPQDSKGKCKYENDLQELKEQHNEISEELFEHKQILKNLESQLQQLLGGDETYSDCLEVYKSGQNNSGIYEIFVESLSRKVSVYCDMDDDGGGWTVFQRRVNDSVDFYRDWDDYKEGFGNLENNHWLGNDILAGITSGNSTSYKLRVTVVSYLEETGIYEYLDFRVDPESEKYRLHIDDTNNGFPDDNGKGLSNNNGMYFTTRDRDNDNFLTNCAANDTYVGAWWYTKSCGFTNLNSPYWYTRLIDAPPGAAMLWYPLDQFYTLKYAEMKIRPKDF